MTFVVPIDLFVTPCDSKPFSQPVIFKSNYGSAKRRTEVHSWLFMECSVFNEKSFHRLLFFNKVHKPVTKWVIVHLRAQTLLIAVMLKLRVTRGSRYFNAIPIHQCRSQWSRGLRHRSSAACLLRLWVRIPPGTWMFVCSECCVLSVRGLCDGLITRPEESYRLWRVVVCDQETAEKEEAKARYRAVKIQP